MDHGKEVFGQLVIASGNPAEVLELGEEPFDQVPLAIEPCAEVGFRPAVGLGRDIGEGSFLAQRCPEAIGIVRLIRQYDCSSVNVIEEIVSRWPVMALTSGQA